MREELEQIKPMPAVFYPEYVKRLRGTHVKSGTTKASWSSRCAQDIRRFKADAAVDRAVAVWCGSTEVYIDAEPKCTRTIATFEAASRKTIPAIIAHRRSTPGRA